MNNDNHEKKLSKLQSQINRLKEGLAKERGSLRAQQRRDATRLKILLGGAILSLLSKGGNQKLNDFVRGLVWTLLADHGSIEFIRRMLPDIVDKPFASDLKMPPKPKPKPRTDS